MEVSEAKRLKQLECENAELKKPLAMRWKRVEMSVIRASFSWTAGVSRMRV